MQITGKSDNAQSSTHTILTINCKHTYKSGCITDSDKISMQNALRVRALYEKKKNLAILTTFILPLCDIKNLATFFKNKTTSGMQHTRIFILWDKIEVLLGTCWGTYLRMHRSSHFFFALMTNVRSSTLTRPNDTHGSSHIDDPIRSVVLASPAHSLCSKCFPWHVAPTRLSFLHPHSVCFQWHNTGSSFEM